MSSNLAVRPFGRLLRHVVPILVLSTLGLRPATVAAQTTENAPTIQSLQVDLWPEYDRPQVLVIYRIQLAEGSPLPATISVPIPAGAGEPFAVGMGLGAEGRPLLAAYTRQVEGDWATITLETESLLAQVEFYADLTIDGESRQYTFVWPGGVALGSLSYAVQQPIGSTDLAVTPPGSLGAGNDGMSYVRADLGTLDAASTASVTLAYRRTVPGLSIEALQPAAPLSPSGPEAGSSGLETWLPWLGWVGGGLAVILLAGGGYWYGRIGKERASGGSRPRRPRPPARCPERDVVAYDASPVYCHKCGTQAGVSDRLCRRCGTGLRR
jgi:hypothetical protein